MLDINPGVVIGGPLEDTESGVLERFVESRRERVRVPGFGGCEVAFWGCRVYCG